MLKRVLSYAHELLEHSINPGETVIDGTCGNGNDTFVLSRLVGDNGLVLAFDIQEQAISNTANLLAKKEITNVTLIQEDHKFLKEHLSDELIGKIGGAIFNLGYLPGSDKTIITKPESTIQAVDTISSYLKPEGILVLVVYHGHPGGDVERDALLEHLSTYNQKHFSILQYGFINQRNNPPFILAIEKK